MALKKTDYTISRGTEKIEFKRGVLIDGKQSNLTVVASLNYKKGLIKIDAKLDDGQITGEKELDLGTLKTLQDLIIAAKAYSITWRKNWEKENPHAGEKGDPDQIPLDLKDQK